MTEFVGRTGSRRVFSYPETRRGGSGPFARNFATAKELELELADNTVVWTPDVGVPLTNVPITPLSTGVVEIHGVLVIEGGGAANSVTITVNIDGTPVPATMFTLDTIPQANPGAVPFLAQVTLPVGVLANVTVVITVPDASGMALEAGTIAVQEVPTPTG